MRACAFLVGLVFAAHAHAGMGPEEARHLLNRTGFDARLDEIDAYAGLARAEAVEQLLRGVRRAALTPLPAGVDEWIAPSRLRQADAEQRRQLHRLLVERGLALKAWWIGEMLITDSPLTERMTLFWHNHFTSSLQKVRSPALMARQNALLRRHALGSFAELLHAVSKDPAMLVYLDTARSHRGRPNENFAREVMELFTLGEGRYGEQDIKEAARAFTGWSVEPQTGEYRWRPKLHDGDAKTVLGRTGNLGGDEVLDLLLAEPASAEFIVAKLWREFVSPQPDAQEVRRIAGAFRASGYRIDAALRELLLSPAFWAPDNRGALVKSPAELVVGTLRQFGAGVSDPLPFAFLLRNLGEDLFSPPNVKGWPGGDAWINSSTLLARKQFLERLMRADETRFVPVADGDKPMARRFMRAVGELYVPLGAWQADFKEREAMMPLVLLPLPPAGAGAADYRSLVLDAAYQLK